MRCLRLCNGSTGRSSRAGLPDRRTNLENPNKPVCRDARNVSQRPPCRASASDQRSQCSSTSSSPAPEIPALPHPNPRSSLFYLGGNERGRVVLIDILGSFCPPGDNFNHPLRQLLAERHAIRNAYQVGIFELYPGPLIPIPTNPIPAQFDTPLVHFFSLRPLHPL